VYQISSKLDDSSQRSWPFNDFQNGDPPPSWILKICSFCHVAYVGIPFCFLVQTFTKLGQSVDELWTKKAIFNLKAIRDDVDF